MSTIEVNGKTMQTTHQTVQLVVNELGLSQGRYAVKVNDKLIAHADLAKTKVVNGTNIEVVQHDDL
ncbi:MULTISPECIES: sulfur carrier protein ThiS [unclassified Psychrobacter]|uniref:sulfur carrier protein ThiS n=1 Tax=unclassified Psychrobacter TaxID=196806 RepID=UPI003FD022CC